jgi:hypothetical protein
MICGCVCNMHDGSSMFLSNGWGWYEGWKLIVILVHGLGLMVTDVIRFLHCCVSLGNAFGLVIPFWRGVI